MPEGAILSSKNRNPANMGLHQAAATMGKATMGKVSAFLAAAVLVLAGASASASPGFSLSSLKGPYVFQVRGFYANAPAQAQEGDIGKIAALGLLTFDGAGHVSGNVNFTGSNQDGKQATCTGSLSTASNYTVSADGTGGLTLSFTAASNCVTSPTPPQEAKLIFYLILNDKGAPPPATSASVLLSNFVPSLGPNIGPSNGTALFPAVLVLDGGLRGQGTSD